MNVVTAGTTGGTIKGIEAAARILDKANTAQDIMTAEGTLASLIQGLQKSAQKDLASVTNNAIANQVVKKYPVGSPTYDSIVNMWTKVLVAQSSQDFASGVAKQGLAMADTTGLVGLIQTFNQPMCGQHSPMP